MECEHINLDAIIQRHIDAAIERESQRLALEFRKEVRRIHSETELKHMEKIFIIVFLLVFCVGMYFSGAGIVWGIEKLWGLL